MKQRRNKFGSSLNDEDPRFAGIHLAGPNSNRTTLVVLSGNPLRKSMKLCGLYERIGSFGKTFSDDRLLEILSHEQPLENVFVDAPLTAPPCVTCPRAECPGVHHCEDVSVAFMMSLAERKAPRRQRRGRPIHPQNQRVWDVHRWAEADNQPLDASFSANAMPLFIRAAALEKRLRAATQGSLHIGETNVRLALEEYCRSYRLPAEWWKRYRSFEEGQAFRQKFLDHFQNQGWLSLDDSEQLLPMTHFHALVTALVAGFAKAGISNRKPDQMADIPGWLHLPILSESIENYSNL